MSAQTDPTSGPLQAQAGWDQRSDLRILLLHGIGRQKPGEHLLTAVEPIVDSLRGAVPPDHVKVVAADLAGSEQPESGQPHVSVRVAPDTTWHFVESYWADAFPEPTYRELMFWCLRVVPFALVSHGVDRRFIARSKWHALSAPPAGEVGRPRFALLERAWAIAAMAFALFQLLLLVLLIPAVILTLVSLMLVALVPIGPLRSMVLNVQRWLAGTVGDSHAFTHRPVLRTAVLEVVRADLDRLRSLPGKAPIVVIAHSQGAAIAYELLEDPESSPIDLLITYGSGLDKLRLVRNADDAREGWWKGSIQSGDRAKPAPDPRLKIASFGVMGAILLLVSAPGLIDYVTAQPFGNAARLVLVLLAVAGALLVINDVGLTAAPLSKHVAVGVAGVLLVVAYVFGFGSGLFSELPQALFATLGWTAVLSSVELCDRLAAQEGQLDFPHTRDWVDMRADADPVPSRGFRSRTAQGRTPRTERFTLTGSMFRDHVSYWRHPDAFVWQVIVELLRQSGLQNPADSLESRGRAAATNRTARVRARTALRVAGVLAVLLALLTEPDWVQSIHASALVPHFAAGWAPPTWLPGGWNTLDCALVVGTCLAAYHAVLVPWRLWDRLHVRAFDRGDPAPTDIGERWSFITAAPLVLTAALLSLWNPVGRVVGSLGEALLVALLTLLARSVLSGAVAVARLLTRREMTFRGLDRWLLSSALAILPGAVFLVATGATALPQVLSPEIAQNDHWVAIALGVIGIAAAECRTWAAGQPGQADATSHLIQVDPAVSEPCEPHAA